MYNSNISVGQALLSILRRFPTKVVQISDDSGDKMNAKEMEIKSIRVAMHLANMGYRQNDVIGVMAKNDKNLSPLVIGILTLGASINPLDASFTKST